jgi:hypothetical protein
MHTTIINLEELEYSEADFPKDISDNFALQLALTIQFDNEEYFIKLLSPYFFADLTMKEKFSAAVVAIGLAKGNIKKYLHYLILDTSIDRETYDSSLHEILADKGFDSDYITDLFGLREFKKLDKELPINSLKEEKRTKV